MAREERPISTEQVPEAVRWYMDALRPHLGHTFVRQHFHQVTWLSFAAPGGEPVDFYALEFRAGGRASLIWSEAPDRWCIGRYIPLAHPDADTTCHPSGLTASYWRECAVSTSLAQAISFLEAATPAPFRVTASGPE
jgi:hypothetical protein